MIQKWMHTYVNKLLEQKCDEVCRFYLSYNEQYQNGNNSSPCRCVKQEAMCWKKIVSKTRIWKQNKPVGMNRKDNDDVDDSDNTQANWNGKRENTSTQTTPCNDWSMCLLLHFMCGVDCAAIQYSRLLPFHCRMFLLYLNVRVNIENMKFVIYVLSAF